LRRRFLSAFSPVATGALLVLVATGIGLGAIELGQVGKVFSTAYGRTVTAKVCLLGVAVGFGFYHRLSVGRRRRSGRRTVVTVPMEAGVLVGVIALAAGLTGLQPAGNVIAFRAAQAKAQAVVADPADCVKQPAFEIGCWNRYFDTTVKRKGAEVALVDLNSLYNTKIASAQSECHQLAHTIGRSAARKYPTLYGGLHAGAQLGNICNSGYWHGLLEETISGMSDPALQATLNNLCIVDGVRRYSFDNFNCIHGLGHGLTLRYAQDIFQALPWCDRFSDYWDQQSCYGGVFMQNIIADQQEGGAVNLKRDDLVYPCNAVAQRQKTQCYQLVPDNVLKAKAWDTRAAFAICDTIEEGFSGICYRGVGRDISGATLLDPAGTLRMCQTATTPLGLQECIAGAVSNAVDDTHKADKATALCQIVPTVLRASCLKARDTAVSLL
jgi:hypothetical protein